MRQKTISSPVSLEGIGLQTGIKARINFKPSPANSGINFIRTDLANKPVLHIQSLSLNGSLIKGRRTSLGAGEVTVETTEHLLAAVSGLGINNIAIEIDGVEVPGLDGSAKDYAQAFARAGVIEQDASVEPLTVERPVWCSGKGSFLAAFPHDGLRVSFFISYPDAGIGRQFLSIDISEETFMRDIAPARTFCMKKEALLLKVLGFGKGANNRNTLIIGKDSPVGNRLRFPDEPVRHKILDLLGDLCLVGTPVRAHIVAVKSGHVLNMELVKKLKGE